MAAIKQKIPKKDRMQIARIISLVEKKETFGRCRIITTWEDWEHSIHNDDAQISRQGCAMTYPMDIIKINEKKKTGRFSGTNAPYYNTTLSSCTCFDFQTRKLPCKHIYRLAVELNMIEIIKRSGYDKEKLNEIKKSYNIDTDPEQVKRQNSGMEAKCKPVEINYETKTALFAGSAKEPYSTTIDSCTCRDYFVRRLPCKHIYRLRHELLN